MDAALALEALLPFEAEDVELSELSDLTDDVFMSALLDASAWAAPSGSGGSGSACAWDPAGAAGAAARPGARDSSSSEEGGEAGGEASARAKVWPTAAAAAVVAVAPASAAAPVRHTVAAAVAPPPPPRLQLHRCLDSAHASPCALCTPAPAEAETADYEVVGEVGKRNGEKLLRALLIQTREWNTQAAREALASVCDARGADDASLVKLAGALRNKRSAALTKEHLLFAARAWGYACHLWQRHGRASRKRAAEDEAAAPAPRPPPARAVAPPAEALAAAAAAAQHASRPLPSSAEARLLGGGFRWGTLRADTALDALITPHSVTAEMDAQLRPLAAAAALLLAGPDARTAACGGACAYFSAADLAEVRSAHAFLAGGAAEWRAAAAGTAAARDAAAHAAHTDAIVAAQNARPAWCIIGRDATPLELALRAVCATLRGWANNNRAPAHADTDDAPDAVARRRWHAEFFRALVAVTELCTRLQLLLVDAKLASYDTYLRAAALVADATVSFSKQAAGGLAARAAWMAHMLPPPRAGDSSSAGSAAAATTAAEERGGRRLLFTCDATAAAAVSA
jgi:hypothetical protein